MGLFFEQKITKITKEEEEQKGIVLTPRREAAKIEEKTRCWNELPIRIGLTKGFLSQRHEDTEAGYGGIIF